MFDLGELGHLSAKDLLKITHVFVTHTHMDHFIGFDTLLRIFLGREKQLHLFGPPDFFCRVEGKLAGYTWNLVDEYQNNFSLRITEVHSNKTMTKTLFCHDRFRSDKKPTEESFSGILLEESAFHIKSVLLDHRIPCLGLSLVEKFYINIMKEGLKELGLPVGPWINRFKKALYEKRDMASDFLVTIEEKGQVIIEKEYILGELAKKIARISPGQQITYLTDIIGNPENFSMAVQLASKADHLFIEAPFLDCDRDMALKKYHLTAKEAGELANKAGVKQMTPFHFSPRYSDRFEEIRREAETAYVKNDIAHGATSG